MKKYGLYDTKENCWLGDTSGPRIFDEKDLAKIAENRDSDKPLTEEDLYTIVQIAARMVDVQLKQPAGRTRAMPFTEGDLILKDTQDVHMSGEEALRKLENGEVL